MGGGSSFDDEFDTITTTLKIVGGTTNLKK
jgi:hypothetical protein